MYHLYVVYHVMVNDKAQCYKMTGGLNTALFHQNTAALTKEI